MLSAIHPSLNTCREAEEVHVSLLALLAAMIKHELLLLVFGAIGSHFHGNPESLAAMLEFGGMGYLCFPLFAKVSIAFVESYLDL